LLGIGKGFEAIKRADLIPDIPKLIGVQARACAPICAFSDDGDIRTGEVSEEDTIAEGICIDKPIRSEILVKFIKENGGLFIAVEEKSIIHGFKQLARKGFYVELTSAVVYGALKHVVGKVPEPIVLVLTGSGLKTSMVI